MMAEETQLQDGYLLARCCSPAPGDDIIGYHSHTEVIKVHRSDCINLKKTEPARLVTLRWTDIVAAVTFVPGDDYITLDSVDFAILKHHRDLDIDYSLKVAGELGIAKQEAFDRHQNLRSSGLLERVEALMVRYRKKVAAHKWIKHRNHTYYRLTEKGYRYLEYYLSQGKRS